MATKFQAPNVPFIKARHFGGSQRPKAIVMHGTVSSDNPGTARQIAQWWNGPRSPITSAHYTVDPGEVIQSVGDHSVAFHCGYNTGSIAVELCDEQQGPASRWTDSDSRAILARAAHLAAQLCLAYGIDPVRPSVSALKSKGPHGIYGHNDSRLAFGHTTHSDPIDFPWDRFLVMVRAEMAKLRDVVENPPKPVKPPKPVPVPRPTRHFYVIHSSQQYSDTNVQHTADIEKLFARGADWITGTEAGAGSGNMTAELERVALATGYRFHRHDSTWIAVRRDLGKLVSKGFVPVLKGSHEIKDVSGHYGPRGIPWIKIDIPGTGIVTLGVSHYLTKGRTRSQTPPGPNNHFDLNEKYQAAVEKWATEHGAGTALVFWGADTNQIDRITDVAPGLVTCWDELKKWPNTGHGNIDVIARGAGDTRSKFVRARVLDDSALFMNTDHFVLEAWVDIVNLPA